MINSIKTETCEICGEPNKRRNTSFCSHKCYVKSHAEERICEICGKKFEFIKWYSKRTCSHKCGTKINPALMKQEDKWIDVECAGCNKKISVRKIRLAKSPNISCSHKCAGVLKSRYFDTTLLSSKKDKYYSNKNSKFIRSDSCWEHQRMIELDLDPNVIKWDRCYDKIPYTKQDGTLGHYNPDFYIEYKDDVKVVEEIKGFYTENVHLKIKEATLFYSSKDIEYRILDKNYFKNNDKIFPIVEEIETEYGIYNRPKMETIWMKMAQNLASRSTCLRLGVGAVVVNKDMTYAPCLGYNGNFAGGENCCDSLEPGKCGCSHAEINALTKSKEDLNNCTLFCTASPCVSCAKILINRGIKKVIYLNCYRSNFGIRLLRENGVEVFKYNDLFEFSDEE